MANLVALFTRDCTGNCINIDIDVRRFIREI